MRELSRDARQPNLALADRVGLSPSACLRRIQALERADIIRCYRAVLDPAKLGIGFVAYVTVGLGSHTKPAQEAFERAVARAPEVRECHNITGTVEYLLRVECADLAALKHWHTEVLGTLPQVRARRTTGPRRSSPSAGISARAGPASAPLPHRPAGRAPLR